MAGRFDGSSLDFDRTFRKSSLTQRQTMFDDRVGTTATTNIPHFEEKLLFHTPPWCGGASFAGEH